VSSSSAISSFNLGALPDRFRTSSAR
jgi:hypothetical protein